MDKGVYVCLDQQVCYIWDNTLAPLSLSLSSDQYTMDEEESGRWGSHISAEPSLSTIRSPQMEVKA